MSQLYIRLRTGFYSHVKTLRLRARLGNDAFWLVPRIWCLAAEHSPNGDLSKYSAEDIAMLVGYQADAQAMLVALKDCGFIDLDGKIHDWDEHNGYHHKFSARASNAANARWDKERMKRKEKGEKETSIASSNAQASNPPLSGNGHLTDTQRIIHHQEFKDAKKQVATLKARYANGESWHPNDKAELQSLKTRQIELKEILGVKV